MRYILGDAMDRGPEPIRVFQDIMNRPNVIYIWGNHDVRLFLLMKKLLVEVTEENAEIQLNTELLCQYHDWLEDGRNTTIQQFRKLSVAEQKDLMCYLEECASYEILEQEEKQYILVHVGLGDFSEEKDLEEYELVDLVEVRADYDKKYFSDDATYLLTGHTPTIYIEGWKTPEVYRKHNHVALDCGCVGTGALAAFCVETEAITYVKM